MTISEAEAAARTLYPNTKFSDVPAADATADAKEAAARSLYPNTKFRDAPAAEPTADAKPEPHGEEPTSNVPENIQELRKADPARGLFDVAQHYGQTGLEDALGDAADVPADVRAQAAREYKQIFADHGLTQAEASELVSIARQVSKSPPSEEQQAAWRDQAEKRLKEIYGSDMQEAIADARKLVARDPRVAVMLERTRLGNHPHYIVEFARIARSEKLKGRL